MKMFWVHYVKVQYIQETHRVYKMLKWDIKCTVDEMRDEL